jgi:hypothetical protein
VKAKAYRAQAQEPLLAFASATHRPGAKPIAAETRLPSSLRLRAALQGAALGALALTAAMVGGLAIAAGPFHASLGSIA